MCVLLEKYGYVTLIGSFWAFINIYTVAFEAKLIPMFIDVSLLLEKEPKRWLCEAVSTNRDGFLVNETIIGSVPQPVTWRAETQISGSPNP